MTDSRPFVKVPDLSTMSDEQIDAYASTLWELIATRMVTQQSPAEESRHGSDPEVKPGSEES